MHTKDGMTNAGKADQILFYIACGPKAAAPLVMPHYSYTEITSNLN